MAKKRRDIGTEILEGIRHIKAGRVGRITERDRAVLDRRLDAYELDGDRGRLVDDVIADVRKKL